MSLNLKLVLYDSEGYVLIAQLNYSLTYLICSDSNIVVIMSSKIVPLFFL